MTEDLQKKIDDARVEGWKVKEETGESRAVMVRHHYGSFVAHLLIFIFFGWWTLGGANLLYLAYKYFFDSEKKVVRTDE